MVAADARTAVTFTLSPGQAHDCPEGRQLLRKLGEAKWPIHLIMDRAYEGDETRQLRSNSILFPWFRLRTIESTPGSTTAPCTSGATRLSDCFVAPKAFAVSFRGSKNLMSSLSALSSSP